MAKVNYDIIVDDDNIRTVKTSNKEMSKDFEDALASYIDCLKIISEEGFIQGQIAENVKNLYEQVILLKDEVSSTGKNENADLTEFLENIDQADSVLY